jgi:hypothetical protein
VKKRSGLDTLDGFFTPGAMLTLPASLAVQVNAQASA